MFLEFVLPHDAENRRLVEQACVEFERDLRGFLLGVLRDRDLADEALQRTFVKGIEASDAVDPATVRGWLFKIALNEARELKRVTARQNRLHKAVWETLPTGAAIDEQDAAFYAVTEEQKLAVQEALLRLSDDFRDVVIRRIQRGQTFAKIAEEIDRPLGTVLTWMRRALIELGEMTEIRNLSKPE